VSAVAPLATEDVAGLSLHRLMEPEVLANPYPLFHRLRSEDPVHWDPFLHCWVVTRYEDVQQVLHTFLAARTPSPEQLEKLGLDRIAPLARIMVRQMLFLDPPDHARLRRLASTAFTPRRVEGLRSHIKDIANRLVDQVADSGRMDVIADLAAPLPAVVTAEMFGVPTEDHGMLKDWSTDFAEMLGNFQHNPDRVARALAAAENMSAYFRDQIAEHRRHPHDGLIQALIEAEVDGSTLTLDELVANLIVTMVGGQETTTNLIGNGLLSLLRWPEQLARLDADRSLMAPAVEELLRFEAPSQHTARLAPQDLEMGGKTIRKRQAVIAVMAAANRDPGRFPDPDRLDIAREDNRHVSFGWGPHFCFGAPLARLEGQIVFETVLDRMKNLELDGGPLEWRTNLGLRGLTALPVRFRA